MTKHTAVRSKRAGKIPKRSICVGKTILSAKRQPSFSGETPKAFRSENGTNCANKKCPKTDFVYLRIYRKTVSNLHIREQILGRNAEGVSYKRYGVGPTLIWTETPSDLAIFTTDEAYTNFMGFEAPFSNPRSPKYLPKLLSSKKMRMKKGTILIKESTPENAMHIPVHFCAYRIDENGKFTIFDPSWHSTDAGIYSTTAFYDSLDAFGISYCHAEPLRAHHWQSKLPHDVFCQTWSLWWLLSETRAFPLPKTQNDAICQMSSYIGELSRYVLTNVDTCMAVFPEYKLEGNDPKQVFHAISCRPKSILASL
jgi:hypothetical protein